MRNVMNNFGNNKYNPTDFHKQNLNNIRKGKGKRIVIVWHARF